MLITAAVKSHRSGVTVNFTNTNTNVVYSNYGEHNSIASLVKVALQHLAIIGDNIDDLRIDSYREIQSLINSCDEIYGDRVIGTFIHERVIVYTRGHPLLTMDIRGEEKKNDGVRIVIDSIVRTEHTPTAKAA